jgi:hypothetical protein
MMLAGSCGPTCFLEQEDHQHTPERQWHHQTIKVISRDIITLPACYCFFIAKAPQVAIVKISFQYLGGGGISNKIHSSFLLLSSKCDRKKEKSRLINCTF